MRIRHVVPMVAAFCMAVAGCTTVSPGEATPEAKSEVDSTSPGRGGDLPSNGAPKVEHPLTNTSQFEQDPCSILTAMQAGGLGLPTIGKEAEGALGLNCDWRNPDTRGQVTIGFFTNNDRGLSGFYAENQKNPYPYFKTLPDIEGYPAITSDNADRRSEGICLIQIGVTDRLAFHVDLYLSRANAGKKDPCETGVKVAGLALQTMKGA